MSWLENPENFEINQFKQFFHICLYLEITPERFFDPNFRSPSLLKKSLKLMEKMTNKELENLNVIMESMVGSR